MDTLLILLVCLREVRRQFLPKTLLQPVGHRLDLHNTPTFSQKPRVTAKPPPRSIARGLLSIISLKLKDADGFFSPLSNSLLENAPGMISSFVLDTRLHPILRIMLESSWPMTSFHASLFFSLCFFLSVDSISASLSLLRITWTPGDKWHYFVRKTWKNIVFIQPKETMMDHFNTLVATMCVVCPLPSAGKQSRWERKSQTGWNLLFCYLILFSLEEKEQNTSRRQGKKAAEGGSLPC